MDVTTIESDFEDIELRAELLADLEQRLLKADVDVSDALSRFSPQADESQKRLIESTAKRIRMVAPAGSGKTQTVINRVMKRISDGVKPSRVLTLTFDNSAVSSLQEKLRESLTSLQLPGLTQDKFTISTLNSFGFGVLRQHFPAEFRTVVEPYRARRLMQEVKDALKERSPERFQLLPTNVENQYYLDFFSLLKNVCFDPRHLDGQAAADFILSAPQGVVYFEPRQTTQQRGAIIQALLWMFAALEKAYQRESLMDFDDQKLRALVCLRGDPQTMESVQRRFDEVIVDEFQDINKLDFELIRDIALASTLLVTGDDDQAIYGFRGCTPEYIINFDKYVGKTATYELRVNYRSPRNIVDMSSRLIRHNKWRIKKHPVAHRSENASVKVIASRTSTVEAKLLVSYINQIRNHNPLLKLSDFAVLYRTNAQSLPIQIEFILNEVPYFVRPQDNVLQNQLLEKLLAVLRVKLALEDRKVPEPPDAALCVGAYFRYVQPSDLQSLERLFRSEPDFFATLSSGKLHAVLPKAASSNIESAMHSVLNTGRLMDSLDVLAQRFHGLRGMIGSLEDVVRDRVPLGEVYELAASFEGNTRDFVRTLDSALRKAKRQGSGRNEDDGVALLTFFKAKGRQWHTVMLVSCNQGLIPHARAPLEDERRLFYVAMTRATSNLVVSYLRDSCGNAVRPSQFLAEAGLRDDA